MPCANKKAAIEIFLLIPVPIHSFPLLKRAKRGFILVFTEISCIFPGGKKISPAIWFPDGCIWE